MDKVSKLMVFLIVAVTLPALLVAGRPAETQKCTITGDIISNTTEPPDLDKDVVEIGISAWVLLDDDGQPASLLLKGSLLQESDEDGPTGLLYAPIIEDEAGNPRYVSCTGEGSCNPQDPLSLYNYFEYYGHARVLKKNERFDFEFGPLLPDGSVCESVTYEDLPPPFGVPPKEHLCPYFLTIQDGLYDRTADVVTFDGESYVGLVDYSLGPLGVHVGDGPVSGTPIAPGITIAFLTDGDGDETEPEKGALLCDDEFDNDGDGLVDCDDPNCKKWCR